MKHPGCGNAETIVAVPAHGRAEDFGSAFSNRRRR